MNRRHWTRYLLIVSLSLNLGIVGALLWPSSKPQPAGSPASPAPLNLQDHLELNDLAFTTHDPLLAQLRYRLRKHHGAPRDGKKMAVTCVFSRESVAPPDPSCGIEGDGSLNCHGYGSVVAVTATFGQCAAGWVLDALAGHSEKNAKSTL